MSEASSREVRHGIPTRGDGFSDGGAGDMESRIVAPARCRRQLYGPREFAVLMRFQAREETLRVRAASRANSGRWKWAGSSPRRAASCSGEEARRVTWPSLRPGRGDLP